MKTAFKLDPENKSRVMVTNVRLAFAQDLITARAMKKDDGSMGDPRFGCTLLIPNGDAETLKAVQTVMWVVAQEKWGAKAQAIWQELSASQRLALKDGATKASKEGFLGNYFISAGAKQERPPMLLHKYLGADGKVQRLPRPNNVIYSGCYANVQLQFWAQENQYGKRINADVLAVQFVADGTSFGGGGGGEADLSQFEGMPSPEMGFGAQAPAAPAAQAPAPQAPAFAGMPAFAPPAPSAAQTPKASGLFDPTL